MNRPLSCLFFAALTAVATSTTSDLFYIYEFPAEALDTWPKYGHPLRNTSVWNHAFNENEGFGRLHGDTQYFETWQYSSFRLILSRLLRSKYRTRDITKASLFFIPYDGAAETYISRTGNLRQYGNPFGDWLLEQLPLYPTMRKYKGLDHVLIHSTGMANRKINIASLAPLLRFFLNSTVLVPEKFPLYAKGLLSKFRALQALPMPSAFHWREGVGKASIPVMQPFRNRKEIFISLFDTFETAVKESNRIRYILTEQCDKANKAAKAGESKYAIVKKEFGSVCRHNPFTFTGQKSPTTPLEELEMYEKSVYCLCPPGVTPISQCVFNSLLAGCIPVLLRNYHTHFPLMQYNWHLSKERINTSFVIFDATTHQKLMRATYIEDLVENYSPRDIRKKLRTTAKLAIGLQYSMPPDVRKFGFPAVEDELPTWDPPYADVVEVTLQRLFDQIAKLEPTMQAIAAQHAEEDDVLLSDLDADKLNDEN